MAKKASSTFKFQTLEIDPCPPRVDECRSFIHISLADGSEGLQKKIMDQIPIPEDALKAPDPALALSKVAKESRLMRIYCGIQKLDAVVKSIQETTLKTVIFCSNRDVIVLTQRLLRELGAQSIYGGSDPFTLEKSVNKFNDTKVMQVLVADVRGYASYPGLYATERVIFIDPDWDAEINAKALKTCFVKKESLRVDFVSVKDSIDSYITGAIAFKTEQLI